MSFALVAVLAVATLLVGVGIGYWFGRSGRAMDRAKLSDVENEFGTYREKVTEHFAQTADHFHSIGKQYRELYEHMAAGSEAFCVTADADPRLPFGAADRAAIGLDKPQETHDEAPQEATSQATEEVEASATPPEAEAPEAEPPADYVVEKEEAPAEVSTTEEIAQSESSEPPAETEVTEERAETVEEATPTPLADGEVEQRAERTLH